VPVLPKKELPAGRLVRERTIFEGFPVPI